MDTRRDAFTKKFSDALAYLGGTSIHDLISIKYRDNVNSADYHELIDGLLMHELSLKAEEVQGDFQGHAWLVTDRSRNKVLLIEHETGPEILYIAGSIASLIALIPLITSGWRFLQSRFLDRPFSRSRGIGIEIRIIGPKNQLVEQRVMSIEDYILSESMKEIAALRSRVESLEQQLEEFKKKTRQFDTKKLTPVSRKSKK